MVLEVNDLPIKNWNSKSVEFSIGDPSFNCFVETYVITRATKTVLGVSTADGKCDAPLPKGVQRVSDMKPLQLSLVSGSEFASQTRLEEEAPTRSLIFRHCCPGGWRVGFVLPDLDGSSSSSLR